MTGICLIIPAVLIATSLDNVANAIRSYPK